jgi:nicotinamide phosphoribosyltransferase
MFDMNPIFLIDFYKAGHIDQYPKDTQYVFSNWTPRSSHVPGAEHVVHFGLQYFIKEILQNQFERFFFSRDKVSVINEYLEVMTATLGGTPRTDHIEALHDLGYLPLRIYSLPEGTNVPLKVPAIVITNTDPRFFWLVNYVESIMSNILWKPTTSATTAQRFRRLFTEKAKQAGETNFSFIDWQGHDFSFRGMSGREDAILSGMGHLLSFSGTDTLPAILAARHYYGAKLTIGGSVPATEHSVMCAYGNAGEMQTFEHLLTEVYPSAPVLSVVSDTWDLWRVLTEYIPALKEKIQARGGKLVIRPDSGDPVKIITGDREPGADGADKWDENTPQYKGALALLAEALGTYSVNGGKNLISNGGLIYGDGISVERADAILTKAIEQGFSPYNIVFGIGSFTYEYQTRDTYGFAMKATAVVRDGAITAIYKDPVTDDGMKKSLKGIPLVMLTQSGFHVIEGIMPLMLDSSKNAMKKVFEDGALLIEEKFETIRERVQS